MNCSFQMWNCYPRSQSQTAVLFWYVRTVVTVGTLLSCKGLRDWCTVQSLNQCFVLLLKSHDLNINPLFFLPSFLCLFHALYFFIRFRFYLHSLMCRHHQLSHSLQTWPFGCTYWRTLPLRPPHKDWQTKRPQDPWLWRVDWGWQRAYMVCRPCPCARGLNCIESCSLNRGGSTCLG